jgi:transcriptional repressor NrdR
MGGVKSLKKALPRNPKTPQPQVIDMENIVNEIEDQAIMKGKINREISTEELGELVLEKLNIVDKVAYIRFASVYRHFENLDEFIKEVNKLGE